MCIALRGGAASPGFCFHLYKTTPSGGREPPPRSSRRRQPGPGALPLGRRRPPHPPPSWFLRLGGGGGRRMMAPVTWAHGGAGAPGSLSSAHCSGACTPVCAGPARGARAPRARVGLRRPHARLPALHSSHPPLRGSVVCSALQQYQNFKKTGTGRWGGPGQGTQRQDDSGRSWCREYQVHLISSQEGLGLSGAGVTEKQCCPLPPLGHCSRASWAVWAPQPCSAPCRLGHRKPHLPRPRCRPCLAPTFGRGRQLSRGTVAAGSRPGRGPSWPMHAAQAP